MPYGTTEFSILNPVPSRGHSIGRSTSPTQQDDGWLSDDGHGIITKYLPQLLLSKIMNLLDASHKGIQVKDFVVHLVLSRLTKLNHGLMKDVK